MPADQQGQARKLPSGKWQLRYYDRHGTRHSAGAFPSRSAALRHYREEVEPELNGRKSVRRDLMFSELVDTFLERHAKVASPRTIRTLRERLQRPLKSFGAVPVVELEG